MAFKKNNDVGVAFKKYDVCFGGVLAVMLLYSLVTSNIYIHKWSTHSKNFIKLLRFLVISILGTYMKH